ncbi:precorrin-2 dehydrogenase/sirohydrochlorin ferrochelatase family protein [Paenibacillus rubinfantis]|uniref:precorrin-2 dehydrogenase/sirohydrochlorin ferrochelatase family protein n=1 Tax=Paenibacillus rubinfantis TaxID=1720296 RepID=UPI00073ED982|nr:bifunctional precorrin-2 dehydrogenase/sirohydrochlorin ferrochelatase [Paenibacillus rubinfantis]
MPYYVPVLLNLAGRRCVVIGGGTVAERKATMLAEAGAVTVVVSPAITEGLLRLHHEREQVVWIEREYRQGDLAGAFLAFAATDRPEVNAAVTTEAEAEGIPLNDAGEGARGSMITPGVLRRGDLVVAVSTSGAGPTAARQLIREIDEHFGEDYEQYINYLSSARAFIKERITDPGKRKNLFRRLAETDILTLIREGSFRPWSEAAMIAWVEEQTEE